jgi:hypothetical protein
VVVKGDRTCFNRFRKSKYETPKSDPFFDFLKNYKEGSEMGLKTVGYFTLYDEFKIRPGG